MFGIYRTLLAILVVIGHLFGPYQLGTYAVFGFYVLSGYLMTLIMNESYGYNNSGRIKFIKNRILRIYPSYYISISISILMLFLFGDRLTEFKSAIFYPSNVKDLFQNLFIIFPPQSKPRLSPATWALTVELFFYLLICIGISSNKNRTRFWTLISILITGLLLLFTDSWIDRYFTIYAGSLPFSIGSLIYYEKVYLLKILQFLHLKNPVVSIMLMISNFSISYVTETILNVQIIFTYGFYFNLAIVSLLLISLTNLKTNEYNYKVDHLIGKYSYPIYLVHWQAGGMIYILSNSKLQKDFLTLNGVLFLVLSIALAIATSYIIITFVEKPIEKLRVKVKSAIE